MKYEGIKQIETLNEYKKTVCYGSWTIHEVIDLLRLRGADIDVNTIYELFYLAIRYCKDRKIDANTYKDLEQIKHKNKLNDEVFRGLNRMRSSFYLVYDTPMVNTNDKKPYRSYLISVIRYCKTDMNGHPRVYEVKVAEIGDKFDGTRIGKIIPSK
jgi:hypothetical protein